MANEDAASGSKKNRYTVTVLGAADAGEILTLQRAAYVTEAQAHHDFDLPPLTQSLDELCAELNNPDVVALGFREDGRLVGAMRLRRVGSVVELGRLTVVPDRRGRISAAFCSARLELCSKRPLRCGSSRGSTRPLTFACMSGVRTSRWGARL